MLNHRDGQELIDAFFAGLELRNLAQCTALVTKLQLLSKEQPIYDIWSKYFAGILANERDNDFAESERIFLNLLQLSLEQALRGRVYLALGRTYEYQGRWSDAICAYENSLSDFTELHEPFDQARVWKQIAITYRRGFTRGEFSSNVLEQAISYCKLALEVLEPVENPPPDIVWLIGSVWNTLGLLYRSLAQWDKAINCFQRELLICRSQEDRHGIGVSYLNLGEVYQKRGSASWQEALLSYQQALSIVREFDDHYLEVDVLANLGFLYQEMGQNDIALEQYRQAIDLVENMRAGISSEAARAGFFATVVDIYANTILLCIEMDRMKEAFNTVERARARSFLDVLASGTPELAQTLESSTITLAEVQRTLPLDTLLVEYFTTGLVEARASRAASGQDASRHRFPPAKTLIFVITHDEIRVYDAKLSPNDLRPRRRDGVVERHFLQPEIRSRLYDKLVAPFANRLHGQRRLYIVPHGPLHYIPYQALLASGGDTLLQVDGPQIVYAPSATLLFSTQRAPSGPASISCLALGYNSASSTRLRFGEDEARSIAKLTGGQFLVGPSSKKPTLYAQATNCRLLHFSCHGDFRHESPLDSALYLGVNETLTGWDVMAHLHLRCELVTLSACESGLSQVRRGDELFGLIRAFIYAGAPALIATLWRVNEIATRILMERFYQSVQTGAGFAEALKEAQLYLKQITRQEVRTSLSRFANAEKAVLLGVRGSDEAATVLAGDKGLTNIVKERAENALLDGADDDKVFADPYYWASFILVGTHGLLEENRRLKRVGGL